MPRTALVGAVLATFISSSCGAPQSPPHRPTSSTIRVHVEVDPKLDASLSRSGTLFGYWMTKRELDQVMSGSLDLTPISHALEHLVVLGPVDFAKSKSTDVEFSVDASEDVVISLVLSNQQDGLGSMLGAVRSPEGAIMADSAPVKPGGATTVLLKDVFRHNEPSPDPCSGPNHEVVLLEAPEIAGTMGNATTRRVCVVLPASYATTPDRRYPVIYEFPGWGADDAHTLAEFGHDKLVATAAPDAILALVDTSTKSGSSYLVDSPRTGAWDAYVTKRVVPMIDAKYRTIARPEGRATAGLSTGGLGALSIGLRHPEVFGVVTASAPDAPDIVPWLFDSESVASGANRSSANPSSANPSSAEPSSAAPSSAATRTPRASWSRALYPMEVATGGAGFFASYGSDWSPDDSPRGWTLPVDPVTGKLVDAVVAKWRAHSPATWLDDPARAAAIKAAFDNKLCLSVGKHDEFGTYPAVQAFAEKLRRAGIRHEFMTTEQGHVDPDVMSNAYRCAASRLAKQS